MTSQVTWYSLLEGQAVKLTFFPPQRWGAVLQISSDGDDQRIFLCLEISVTGWVGKFGKYSLGWLDLSREFFLERCLNDSDMGKITSEGAINKYR